MSTIWYYVYKCSTNDYVTALSLDILQKAEDSREIVGILSSTSCDTQGDCITKSALESVVQILNKRVVPLIFNHSNIVVGEARNFRLMSHNEIRKMYPDTAPKTDGYSIVFNGNVYDDYETDDKVWDAIQKGILDSFSLGGLGSGSLSNNGLRKIEKLGIWEVTITPSGSNKDAVILKKSEETMSETEQINKMDDPSGSTSNTPNLEEVFGKMLALLEDIHKRIIGNGESMDTPSMEEKMDVEEKECKCDQLKKSNTSKSIETIVAETLPSTLQKELQKLGIKKSQTPVQQVEQINQLDASTPDPEKMQAFLLKFAAKGEFPTDEDFDAFFGGNTL